MSSISCARATVAVLALCACAAAQAQQARPRRGRATPIRDSLDRVIEQEAPRFSVADALRRYRGTGSPAPGVPTVAEVQGQMSGAPASASGGVSGDPVCGARKLWKKIQGKGTSYHLYRTWDERGERPLLTDHRLDPEDYRTNPSFRFEYLGEFDGECAAVAAWNKALRDALDREAKPAEPESPPDNER